MAGNNGGNGDGIREYWSHYDFHEVCDLLNIRITSLFEYINQGKIKMVFFGGRFRILDSEIERFRKQREINLSMRGRPILKRRINNEQSTRVESIM